MKAAQFDQFGEPADVLRVRDIEPPQPKPGELLVRMLLSPINPSDLMTIRGVYGKQPKLPCTPGYEGVGIVEASGGGLLGKLLVGKRVALLGRQRLRQRHRLLRKRRRPLLPVAIDAVE